MQEIVKCIIASHKRPANCVTAQNIKNTAICVPESQAKDYAQHNPKSEIITHPDTVIGLSAKFRWIHKHYPRVAILDDDIYMLRMWIDSKELLKSVVDAETAYDVIQTTAIIADDCGAKLFGYIKDVNPVTYAGHEPFKFSGFVVGGIMGFLEGFQMDELPNACVAATDFYISGLNAYYNRLCVINNRFSVSSKEGTFRSVGGMSEFRTIDTERKDLELLVDAFGPIVTMKGKNPLRKLQHQYEHTFTLPW